MSFCDGHTFPRPVGLPPTIGRLDGHTVLEATYYDAQSEQHQADWIERYRKSGQYVPAELTIATDVPPEDLMTYRPTGRRLVLSGAPGDLCLPVPPEPACRRFFIDEAEIIEPGLVLIRGAIPISD